MAASCVTQKSSRRFAEDELFPLLVQTGIIDPDTKEILCPGRLWCTDETDAPENYDKDHSKYDFPRHILNAFEIELSACDGCVFD